MSEADDRFAIIAVLDQYSECLDTRTWERLDEVFTQDVEMDFEAWAKAGLDPVRDTIRSYLDGCGPSQHLLGNYRIDLNIGGDQNRANSKCYCRVMHFGKGEHEGKTYETWIEYADELIRTESGWRSRKRVARASMHQGDPSLLGPG